MREVKYSIRYWWLTGNVQDYQWLETLEEANNRLRELMANPAIKKARLLKHVTTTTVIKERKKVGHGFR